MPRAKNLIVKRAHILRNLSELALRRDASGWRRSKKYSLSKKLEWTLTTLRHSSQQGRARHFPLGGAIFLRMMAQTPSIYQKVCKTFNPIWFKNQIQIPHLTPYPPSLSSIWVTSPPTTHPKPLNPQKKNSPNQSKQQMSTKLSELMKVMIDKILSKRISQISTNSSTFNQ